MIADSLAYYGYALGWATVRRMPERQAYRTFQAVADRTWKRRGPSVLQLERNLARVVPDADAQQLRALSRDGMRSYARYWCDAFRMPDWPAQRIASFQLDGLEILDDLIGRGEPIVFAAPHAGNYDHGAAFIAQRYGSLTTVAERLRPQRLFERFVAFRERNGLEVLGTGDADLIDQLVDRVNAGRLVGLVAERDLSRRGVPVTFFGEPTRMPAGAAKVARLTGATVIAATFFYNEHGAGAVIHDVFPVPATADETGDVATATQRIADAFAVGIARRPTDWHMLQPLWLADLDPSRGPASWADPDRAT